MILVLADSTSEEALRFGDFQKRSILQCVQEYVNMTKVGKDHYDRDTMVHEFYYVILLCTEGLEADWQQFEPLCKEAVRRVVTMGGAEDVLPHPACPPFRQPALDGQPEVSKEAGNRANMVCRSCGCASALPHIPGVVLQEQKYP